jgi:hypothetical protein
VSEPIIDHASDTEPGIGSHYKGYHLGRRVTVLLVLLGMAASCGLPPDDQVTTINQDDLSESLANATTTTSTSTTLPLPPTVPPPTGPDETATTTTAELIETKPADIFYGIQFSPDLQRLQRNLPTPISIERLIAELESPLPELVTQYNLQSSVRPGLVGPITLSDGIATVPLAQRELDRLAGSQQRRAIGQIVLTLTSFVTANRGAIGSVRFTINGDEIPVFVPSLQSNNEPGEPLSFDDFSVLIIGNPSLPPTTTSTTTTSTTTTVPTTSTTTTTLPVDSEPTTTSTTEQTES